MQPNMWLYNNCCCARIYAREVNYMKKNDLILIVAILLVAGSIYLCNTIFSKKGNEYVVVSVDGKEYGKYKLDTEQKISINNTNTLVIKNGKVDMIEADCPDKLCVHQKPISMDNESIICLPNKVVVEIVSETKNTIDSVAN